MEHVLIVRVDVGRKGEGERCRRWGRQHQGGHGRPRGGQRVVRRRGDEVGVVSSLLRVNLGD